MSDIRAFQVHKENDQNGFIELIRIECIQQGCSRKEKLISVPALTKDYYDPSVNEKRERRVLIYSCHSHINEKQWTSAGNIVYHKLPKGIEKQLMPLKNADQDRLILLNSAKQRMDGQSCCNRENLKLTNLETILTFLSLLSNDNSIIQGLVKKLLVHQYFEYQYLQKQFLRKFQDFSILNGIRQVHYYEQVRRKILKQQFKIINSTLFLQGKSIILKNQGPSLSAISFVQKLMNTQEQADQEETEEQE